MTERAAPLGVSEMSDESHEDQGLCWLASVQDKVLLDSLLSADALVEMVEVDQNSEACSLRAQDGSIAQW
jgi:hypothetical protein